MTCLLPKPFPLKLSINCWFVNFFIFNFMDMNSHNIFVWNYRGAGSDRFRRSFLQCMKDYTPHTAVIMEPRISDIRANEVINRLQFPCSFRVEANGFWGGIWVMWKDGIRVEVITSTIQFIHIRVHSQEGVNNITLIYASPNPSIHKALWTQLDDIREKVGEAPWCH